MLLRVNSILEIGLLGPSGPSGPSSANSEIIWRKPLPAIVLGPVQCDYLDRFGCGVLAGWIKRCFSAPKARFRNGGLGAVPASRSRRTKELLGFGSTTAISKFNSESVWRWHRTHQIFPREWPGARCAVHMCFAASHRSSLTHAMLCLVSGESAAGRARRVTRPETSCRESKHGWHSGYWLWRSRKSTAISRPARGERRAWLEVTAPANRMAGQAFA